MEETPLQHPIPEVGDSPLDDDGFFATSDLSEEELRRGIEEQDWSILQKRNEVKSTDTLSLSWCELRKVPQEVLCLKQLSRLYLSHNSLTQLPRCFDSLKNLQILSIAFNNFTHMPPELFCLENLQVLIVKNNELTTAGIDRAIVSLTKLEELYLDNNQFNDFPEQLCRMPNLLLLTLANNNITRIPDAISKMKKLKVLNLRSNRLEVVPEELGQLKSLELACFAQNRITEFPLGQVENLHNLRDLCVYANRLRDKTAIEDCDQQLAMRGGMLRAEENLVKLPRMGGVCDGPFKIWKIDILWLHDDDPNVKSWIKEISEKLATEHNFMSKDYGPRDTKIEKDLDRSRIVAVVCTKVMCSLLDEEEAAVWKILDKYFKEDRSPSILPVVCNKGVGISSFLVSNGCQKPLKKDGSGDGQFFEKLVEVLKDGSSGACRSRAPRL